LWVLAAEKVNLPGAMNDFLREHTDGFCKFLLQTLIEEGFSCFEGQLEHSSLLIETYNALSARVSASEKEFKALRNTLDIRSWAIAAKKRGRNRSSKYCR